MKTENTKITILIFLHCVCELPLFFHNVTLYSLQFPLFLLVLPHMILSSGQKHQMSQFYWQFEAKNMQAEVWKRGSIGGSAPKLWDEGDSAPLVDILDVKDYVSNRNIIRKY